MKKRTLRFEKILVSTALVGLATVLIMGLSNCGSNRTTQCDAYGQNNIDNGTEKEVKKAK